MGLRVSTDFPLEERLEGRRSYMSDMVMLAAISYNYKEPSLYWYIIAAVIIGLLVMAARSK
jgi:hypothetical protein